MIDFPPLTKDEEIVLAKLGAIFDEIYSAKFDGLPAIQQGGLPAVARYVRGLEVALERIVRIAEESRAGISRGARAGDPYIDIYGAAATAIVALGRGE